MQDSEDTEIVKTADKSEEENLKAKLSKNVDDVSAENNNVENDVRSTSAVNGDAINGEALNGEATNGDTAPGDKYDESTESQTAAISIENSVDDEAAETEKR